MPFERSLEIERRLDGVLKLIRTGRFSTPMLATEVGVSIPTISRIVAALRDRGHDIRAERTMGGGWHYFVARSDITEDRTPDAVAAQGGKQIRLHRSAKS